MLSSQFDNVPLGLSTFLLTNPYPISPTIKFCIKFQAHQKTPFLEQSALHRKTSKYIVVDYIYYKILLDKYIVVTTMDDVGYHLINNHTTKDYIV